MAFSVAAVPNLARSELVVSGISCTPRAELDDSAGKMQLVVPACLLRFEANLLRAVIDIALARCVSYFLLPLAP